MYRPILPLIINRRIGGLESLSNDFSMLEKINTLVTAYNDLVAHLCEIERSFEEQNEKLKDFNNSLLQTTLNAKNILINLENFIGKYGDVTTLSNKIDNVTQTLNSLNERIKTLENKKIDLSEIETKINKLETELTSLKNLINEKFLSLDNSIGTEKINNYNLFKGVF